MKTQHEHQHPVAFDTSSEGVNMPVVWSPKPWRTPNATLICGALLGLLTSLVGFQGSAAAGTYKMYTCNVPGKPVPLPTVGPWKWELDGRNTIGFDNCTTGGTFGIGLNPGNRVMLRASTAQVALRRPADGPFSRIGIVRYKTWLIAQLAGSGSPAFISAGGAFGPSGGANSDAAPWVSPQLAQTNASVIVRLDCSGGTPTNCAFNSARPLQVRGIEVDLYEEAPPSGSIDGGSLISGGTQGGTRRLSYSAADQESGVARVEAILGETVVAVDDPSADPRSCPKTGFNACAGTRSRDLDVNTTRVPDGHHPLSLRVTDAAGNRRVVLGPSIRTLNGVQAHGSLNGTKATDAVRLSAYFARTRRTKLTTRIGKRVLLRGRLLSKDGRPIPRATVGIVERVAIPNAVEADEAAVRTDRTGRFRYMTSKSMSSRTFTLSYRTRHGDLKPAASRKLTLKVRAAASLRVSLRGIIVRYSGQVLTRPLPERGKLVLMQGRARGGAWQTFARRRTGRGGQFAGRYRLRVRRPGVQLQFRVRLPRESGYPFALGTGPTLTRTVR